MYARISESRFHVASSLPVPTSTSPANSGTILHGTGGNDSSSRNGIRKPAAQLMDEVQNRTSHTNSSIPLFRVPPKPNSRASGEDLNTSPITTSINGIRRLSIGSPTDTMKNSRSMRRLSNGAHRAKVHMSLEHPSPHSGGRTSPHAAPRPALSVQTGTTPQRFLNPKSRRQRFDGRPDHRLPGPGHGSSASLNGLENVPPTRGPSQGRDHSRSYKEQDLIPSYARATANQTLRAAQKHRPSHVPSATSNQHSSSESTHKAKRISRNSVSPPPPVNVPESGSSVPPVPPLPTHLDTHGRKLPEPVRPNRSERPSSSTDNLLRDQEHLYGSRTKESRSVNRENRLSIGAGSGKSRPILQTSGNSNYFAKDFATAQSLKIDPRRDHNSKRSKELSQLSMSLPKSQTVPNMLQYTSHDNTGSRQKPHGISTEVSNERNIPTPTKSPYRPVNIPAKIYPRTKASSQKVPSATSSTKPASMTPSVTNQHSQSRSKTSSYSSTSRLNSVGGRSSLTGENITASKANQPPRVKTGSSTSSSPSSLNATIRSKSTAAKAATRRMLLMSPFGGDRHRSPPKPASTFPPTPKSPSKKNVKVPCPQPAPESSEEPQMYEFIAPETVRATLRKLVTSEPSTAETQKYIEQLKVQNRLVLQPSTPAQASTSPLLNLYEKGEILDYRNVYFCGRSDIKKITGDIRRSVSNYGFDDQNGDYQVVTGDHIAYRYEILNTLGKGSFGKVLKCIDHKSGQLVALKMVLNKKRLHMQALVESDLLRTLTGWDAQNRFHLVRYLDHFTFREHLCITTELLGINLYELVKMNGYRGLPVNLVRHFVTQTLEALAFLDSKSIIHCDLKPENLMLCDAATGRIKLIDFGSSCYESARIYTYIQSRFYRSPEVMLGMQYGRPIDIWSLGCITPELLTGIPLFMGEHEQEQIACIMEVRGIPEPELLFKCSRRRLFFDSFGAPLKVVSKKGKTRRPSTKSLDKLLKSDDKDLIDFIEKLLTWDPKKRVRPAEALLLPFIGATDSHLCASSLAVLESANSRASVKEATSSANTSSSRVTTITSTPGSNAMGSTASSAAKSSTRPPKVPIHKTLPKDTRVRSVPAWN